MGQSGHSAVACPDSGASAHMTSNEGILVNIYISTQPLTVAVANGTNLPIMTVGNLTFPAMPGPLHLKFVFHVPHLKYNLISIQKLCADNNCFVIFDKSSIYVKDKISGEVLLQASSKGGVYPISLSHSQPIALISHVARGPVWHRRLGHCGRRILDKLKKSGPILSTSTFSHDCVSVD
ncbi:unnamed protein product [Cuscuta epithymum]|uniref:Retrovirus-related Pol polyprotein from transposon TNT 1-94-like beta-barrel domain-containing protein n=1 Tax=Cuscuta epithymum TaxID=186058 RepID=A0AAV0DGV7_9ASTE|nr:unnamed protein product [Cuscuta epithymum]